MSFLDELLGLFLFFFLLLQGRRCRWCICRCFNWCIRAIILFWAFCMRILAFGAAFSFFGFVALTCTSPSHLGVPCEIYYRWGLAYTFIARIVEILTNRMFLHLPKILFAAGCASKAGHTGLQHQVDEDALGLQSHCKRTARTNLKFKKNAANA